MSNNNSFLIISLLILLKLIISYLLTTNSAIEVAQEGIVIIRVSLKIYLKGIKSLSTKEISIVIK